jgi:hypothetical protein
MPSGYPDKLGVAIVETHGRQCARGPPGDRRPGSGAGGGRDRRLGLVHEHQPDAPRSTLYLPYWAVSSEVMNADKPFKVL